MSGRDLLEYAALNLWKMRLRTLLTTAGVTIGIGAFACLIAFGGGMKKNVTDQFQRMDLFSSIIVNLDKSVNAKESQRLLDDVTIRSIQVLHGVEIVFPEIRIASQISRGDRTEMRFIRVIPAEVSRSSFLSLKHGRGFHSDEDRGVIVDVELLRKLGLRDPGAAIGRTLDIRTVGLDFSMLNALRPGAVAPAGKMPLIDDRQQLPIVGITENNSFGSDPLQSGLFIPPAAAKKMNRLPFSSPWELLRARNGKIGYSSLMVRVGHPRDIDRVSRQIRVLGFDTFALLDQFKEMRTGFFILDMVLFTIGMVAIFVATLGIINTMLMSIFERFAEIGVMKAVGASDRDVMAVFFVESGLIGLAGGLFGLLLGASVSRVINGIVNFYLAKQGVPYIHYFHFSLGLCLGAVLFSLLVSLIAGIYPARRAARVDPVQALRHE